jgi:prepilin-type N-terminal cleavage/methylation domain-containing protein
VSICRERLSRRLRARRGDEGFTLLEVMVAMVILALVAVALIPILVTSSRAEQYAKQATVAKNLAQQRIDAMRNLPFHVDAQNGPFLDLLDDYYPNIKTTATSLPSGGTGKWYSSGTVPGSSATGPYYQATVTNALGVQGFTQDIYTQFLTSAQPLPAAVPATTLTAMSYDSAVSGKDQPPSLLLAVSVVTSWTGLGGAVKSNRTYTEITNTGADNLLILSQSRSTALQVDSVGYDGSQLEAGVGIVKADGSLANTSSATAYAQGVYDTIDGVGVESSASTAVAPPNPSGSTTSQTADGGTQLTGSGSCGGGSFGPSQVSDVSSNTSSALPVAPSDVATGGAVTANLQANGGGSCNGLYFTNQTSGAPSTNPTLQLPSSAPMVWVADASGNGNLVSSKATVSATSAIGNAGAVSSTASVAFATRVQLFQQLPFLPSSDPSTCGANGTSACGRGLVNIFLTSATLTCKSAMTPTASYTGYLTYFTQAAGYKTVSLTYSSATASTDPLASVDITQQVATLSGGTAVRLSDYINSWSTARSISTSGDGVSALGSAVAVNTAPTRAGDSGSTIGVRVGSLSCAAVDNR